MHSICDAACDIPRHQPVRARRRSDLQGEFQPAIRPAQANPATGCPLSAIGSELARSDEKTRTAATAGVRKLVEIMAGQFGKIPPAAARRRALVAVSTMIGALTLSRIVTDPELSAEILAEAEKRLSDG